MASFTLRNPVRDGQGRGIKPKIESMSGRPRSHSIEYVSAGLSQWDASAGASKPLRWYPIHLSPENQLRQSKSASNFQALETIDEDLPVQWRLDQLRINERINFMLDRYDENVKPRRSEDTNTFIGTAGTPRRHSDSDILDLPSPNRYNKRRQQANSSNKRSSNPEIKRSDRPRNSRRKSYVGVESNPDYDTYSDVSDAHSQKSSKSRLSACSDDSLSSASKLAARRRSEADGLSVGNISKASSLSSLVQPEVQGRQDGAVNRTDSVSNISNNNDSSQAQPKRHLSLLSNGIEDPSLLSNLEIPVEFLGSSTSRVRKLLAPIVISLIAVTLLVCLAVAIYFAIALKDSQERQIEILQVTLRFVLAREQQARDISRLTSSELSDLKRAYCQQVDAIYKTSTLTANYKGCEVETLTSERIQFNLYFLDGSAPENQEGANVVEILELRAQAVGVDGSQMRKISDITFDISNKTRSVRVQKTKKAEGFHITSSSISSDTSSLVEASSSLAKIKAISQDRYNITTTVATTISTFTSATTSASSATTSYNTTKARTPTTTATTVTISRPIHIYNDEDNTVVIDTICSSLDPTEVVAHPVDCTHYIQCEFMKPIIRPCAGGLVFNPTIKTCVKPTPDLPCSLLRPCDNINGGYFAHPTNCRLYIICDRGRTVVQSCHGNFLWDDLSKTCVVARNGGKC